MANKPCDLPYPKCPIVTNTNNSFFGNSSFQVTGGSELDAHGSRGQTLECDSKPTRRPKSSVDSSSSRCSSSVVTRRPHSAGAELGAYAGGGGREKWAEPERRGWKHKHKSKQKGVY